MTLDPSLYIFNDQYNAQIIDKSIFELKDKLYYRALEAQNIQRNVMGRTEKHYLLSNSLDYLFSNENSRLKYAEDSYIKNANSLYGTVGDFVIDRSVNTQYGFSVGSYSLKLDTTNIIPYYNKKKFLNTYGYGSVLSLIDIINDHRIFSRRVMFTIDKYLFLKLKIVLLKDGIILVIQDDSTNGIDGNTIRSFMVDNKEWSLYSENQSDFFYTYKVKTSLFTTSKNEISMNQITSKTEFNKVDKVNSYNIAITASTSNPNLLAQSTVALGLEDDGITPCFLTSAGYKTYIMANSTNCYCHIFNNYKKTGYGAISDLSDDTTVMMQIPYTNNPIYSKNINIWNYDSVNDIKLTKIQNNINHIFPNLYDLSFLTRGEDYYIDWYSADTGAIEFDNGIKDYIDCYPNDFMDMTIEQTLPEILLNYTPISSFVYDYDDYVDKINNGDLREYKIIKTIELLTDDGIRYSDFVKNINRANRKYIYGYYNMTTDTAIYNRSVMSNSAQIVYSANLVTFSEAHTYITFSNTSNQTRDVILYIDGLRVLPTLVDTENYKTYVYIKKSLLNSSSKIIIEMPIQEVSVYNKFTGEFTPTEVNTSVAFPQDIFEKIAGNNLVFFDSSTLDYIDKSLFTLSGEFKITYLKNANDEIILQILTSDDYSYFITRDLQYFVTSNGEDFIVQDEYENVSSNLSFNKNISTSNLFIETSSEDILDSDISVTNTDNFKSVSIPDVQDSDTGTFIQFKEDPSPDRFRVYINGILKDEDYTYTPPTKYMDNAEFQITNYEPLDEDTAIIDYLPYKEKTLINSQITVDKLWWREKLTTINLDIKYIAYGNNTFVAIPGEETDIYYTSNDGSKWTQKQLPVVSTWSGVYFVNDIFVLFSYGTPEEDDVLGTGVWNDDAIWDNSSIYQNVPEIKICISSNGINWIGNVGTSFGIWNDDNIWNDNLIWQDDPNYSVYMLDEWEGEEANSLYPINSLIYANDLYVAISNNKFMYSEDIFNWHIANLETNSYEWSSVAYGDGKFIAVSKSYDKIATSTDGITWTEEELSFSTTSTPVHIIYGKDKFIISGYSESYIRESSNGTTWTQRAIPYAIKNGKIVYGNNRYAYISSDDTKAVMSKDGITWESFTLSYTRTYTDIVYGNRTFLSIGYLENNYNIAALSYGKPILYNTNLFDLTLLTDNPFDKNNSKIYINGYRIPNVDIIETKYLNVIKVNNFTPSDTIRIDVIDSDDDCYNYLNNKAKLLYNELLESDTTFNSYIDSNY